MNNPENSGKISVFIITKNEEDRIANVIKCAKDIADEILVIDSKSDDKTAEISRSLGAKVFYNEWRGYGPQKVFGENLCKNKWILNIDADEEISKELSNEIIELFSQNKQDEFVGYKIKIVNKFFGEERPKKWAYYYNQLRLYNKEYCGFKDSTIHDSVIIKDVEARHIVSNQTKILQPKIGQLKNISAMI
jgi:glycosyltransferase involved in cell wall biosynthesis